MIRLTSAALLGALLAAAIPAAAQTAPSPATASPFALDPIVDGSLAAATIGGYGASLWLKSIKPKPAPTTPDPSAIPFFDKAYADKLDATQSTVTDVLLVTTFATPAFVLPGRSLDDLLVLGTMYLETELLAYTSSEIVKQAVVRWRPYAYGTSDVAALSDPDASSSFPSRHSTMAFAAAVFAGRVFDAYEPGSAWSPLVWGTGLSLATVTAAMRVTSGNHFLSDIVAGAVLGSSLGFLVPELHRKRGTSSGSTAPAPLALSPLPGGLGLTLRY
ncbi:MAG TPA: phosphatase PAP2 family protein [Rectinemataceae bacterium]|nr:phosphatase PAP2 family protein [Rectinemataceae bacterium]